MSLTITHIDDWLSSKEIRTHLKISGCELMHLREKGKLEFKKMGNAYFYKSPPQQSNLHDN
jgi:hypothetical protein